MMVSTQGLVNYLVTWLLTAVGVFVDDDTSLKGAVPVRGAVGPEEHLHPRVTTIYRGRESRVVHSGPVLGVKNDAIVTPTTLAVVVDLEVTRNLGEAKGVQEVMVYVGRVEKLRNRRVLVGLRFRRVGHVRVLEFQGRAARPVVVFVGATAAGVDLCKAVVAPGRRIVFGAVGDPGELRSLEIPWVCDDLAVTLVRVIGSPGADNR